MDKTNYYNQAEIWSQNSSDYQYQVLSDILSLIPKDVRSILDVGCGDGHITNNLPQNIRVVGLDISKEALKYVKREQVIGNITNIPFKHNSFDLVMANDVLEHLADEDHGKAIEELSRVASKYIVITVPHNEDIESKKTKCKECGEVYHINWHQRTYDKKTMEKLYLSKPWNLKEIRYSGADTLPPLDNTIWLKHKLGFYSNWKGAVCPNCSSKKQNEIIRSEVQLRCINATRNSLWFSNENNIINNRSELIALFQFNKHSTSFKNDTSNDNKFFDNPLKIDFTNTLQCVDDFIEGSIWPKYKKSEESLINNQGLNIVNKSNKYTEVPIKIPTIARQGDTIRINLSSIDPDSRVAIYAVDGITAIPEVLNETPVRDENVLIDIPIEHEWTSDKFGLAIMLYVYGEVCLHSLEYLRGNKKDRVEIPFIQLKKGHNVLRRRCSDYDLSWGMYLDNSSKYPYPFYEPNDLPTVCLDANQFTNELLEQMKVSIDFSNRKNERINQLINQKEIMIFNLQERHLEQINEIEKIKSLLEEKEEARSKAEEAYKEATKLIQEKENERSKAEEAYKEASRFATLWHKNKERKVHRVLVLSHMFPHPDQRISGPFVHEQVKRLRELEGIDARVISCRPFWLNTISPIRFLKANEAYKRQINEVDWCEYDGVPVMYVPYRVGKPYLPFHLHGLSYKASVMDVIDKVWRNFKFDIVHAHTAYLDGTAGKYVAKHYKVPFVITEHTGPFTYLTEKPIVKQFTLNSIKNANQVWCVSDSLAQEVKSYFTDSNVKSHIDVMYNGVDTKNFYPSNENSNKKSNVVQLLYVGYLEDVKNPINLIHAFHKVKQTYNNVILNIVGEGTLYNTVKNEINRLDLEDSCKLLGLKSRDEVAKIMRENCDIFILPSESETFGVVLIEALATGKPVVATKCGGPESIIREDSVGELSQKNNPEALAEAISKVIQNIGIYDKQKIRQYALSNFDYNILVEKLVNQYENLK